ncbi:hypothetical protein SAMN05216377_110140 [Pseudonocardia oroxyli]|uniref:Uncharacterized protein n=1 Tax=Pseudonocardia oroxyli TaxID=366584 RepID=A0A1G7SYM9_PSEOR|nr:hypothetical protein SAMN05216377_110140 [Pseudonocardia oroxyli]
MSWDSGRVRVTERDLQQIPPGNLRVPRGEFGALWTAAEELNAANGERGVLDWAPAGVALTCRWLARAVSQTSNGRRIPTPAPVTDRAVLAFEEAIEAEYLAAEKLLARPVTPAMVITQPGYVEAVAATLRWAWRVQGAAPVLVPVAAG